MNVIGIPTLLAQNCAETKTKHFSRNVIFSGRRKNVKNWLNFVKVAVKFHAGSSKRHTFISSF